MERSALICDIVLKEASVQSSEFSGCEADASEKEIKTECRPLMQNLMLKLLSSSLIKMEIAPPTGQMSPVPLVPVCRGTWRGLGVLLLLGPTIDQKTLHIHFDPVFIPLPHDCGFTLGNKRQLQIEMRLVLEWQNYSR